MFRDVRDVGTSGRRLCACMRAPGARVAKHVECLRGSSPRGCVYSQPAVDSVPGVSANPLAQRHMQYVSCQCNGVGTTRPWRLRPCTVPAGGRRGHSRICGPGGAGQRARAAERRSRPGTGCIHSAGRPCGAAAGDRQPVRRPPSGAGPLATMLVFLNRVLTCQTLSNARQCLPSVTAHKWHPEMGPSIG